MGKKGLKITWESRFSWVAPLCDVQRDHNPVPPPPPPAAAPLCLSFPDFEIDLTISQGLHEDSQANAFKDFEVLG